VHEWSDADLDRLIEEAIVDAYGEEERLRRAGLTGAAPSQRAGRPS
jgi:hypothetical protein